MVFLDCFHYFGCKHDSITTHLRFAGMSTHSLAMNPVTLGSKMAIADTKGSRLSNHSPFAVETTIIYFLEVSIGSKVRSFFIAYEDQTERALEFILMRNEREECSEHSCKPCLHISRTTTIYLPICDIRCKRLMEPSSGNRHHIQVAIQNQEVVSLTYFTD